MEVPKDDGRLFHAPKSLQKKNSHLSTRLEYHGVKPVSSKRCWFVAGHSWLVPPLRCMLGTWHRKSRCFENSTANATPSAVKAVKVFMYSMMYFSTRLQIDKLVRRQFTGNGRAIWEVVSLSLKVYFNLQTDLFWSRYQLCCILATCSFSRLSLVCWRVPLACGCLSGFLWSKFIEINGKSARIEALRVLHVFQGQLPSTLWGRFMAPSR